MILRVTSSKISRYGIMTIQLLAMLTADHHLLKCGIVVHLVNLRHPFLPPLLMCISCLNPRDGSMSPSSLHVMLTGILRARLQDNDGVQINVHLKCTLDHEDYTSLRFPFTLPYA